MEKPIPLTRGDACPTCGGTLRPVLHAPVKDETELHRCGDCHYQTRFPVLAR